MIFDHFPPLVALYPLELKYFFADSALIPAAHTVMILSSLLNSPILYVKSPNGTLIDFSICPDLYSASVLTSTITAPSLISFFISTFYFFKF